MGIARYYRPDRNEYDREGQPLRAHPGVPLADIDEALWVTYPAWQQAEIDASPLYQKTRPTKEQREYRPATATPEEGAAVELSPETPPEPTTEE